MVSNGMMVLSRALCGGMHGQGAPVYTVMYVKLIILTAANLVKVGEPGNPVKASTSDCYGRKRVC